MAMKLRASCDACHFAKIKCIKLDQGCQRCGLLGERCVNSPALPRKYKKRRRASSTDTSTRRSLSETANNAATAGEIFTVVSSAPINPQTHNRAAYGSNGSYWPFMPEGLAFKNNSSEADVLAPDLSGFAGISPGLSDMFTPTSLATITTPRSSLPSLPQSSISQVKTGDGINIHDLRAPRTLEPCSCFLGILIATQHISEHASLGDPALDSVLCANRAAAKHCITSLNCTHSIDSTENISCGTIACGLLDRVLASYHAAFISFSAIREREGMQCHDRDEDENEDRAAAGGGVKVRLGAFTVDDSEQVLCARKIVTGEIEKLRAAVEGCPNKGGNIRSILREHVIKRCTTLIDGIASWK